MKKTWTIFLVTSLFLTGCISISPAAEAPTVPPQFVTSTLPPTKALVLPSTVTPSTPNATVTAATVAATAPVDCKVQAVLLEDVTIPDDTRMAPGESFTKTWRFKNSGTCHWTGYTINFLTGDRMGAPASAPIPDTVHHPLPRTTEAGSAPRTSWARSSGEESLAHVKHTCGKRSPEQRLPAKLRADEPESPASRIAF